ncbi:spore germination protein [Paenibacillus sp. N4]|uniref:spore germination protein n=1 Tax=Paenibacillus vietnamensis TaxID=2590547 RepID=UPI001CD0FD65|nr:spore germination protein [Paenibacillus vietnamensis]MCA0755535.1 spore germination protein [Paenibacillus vietnamensis]
MSLFKRVRHGKNKPIGQPDKPDVLPSLQQTLDEFKDCIDLVHRTMPEIQVEFVYFGHLVGSDPFTREIAVPFSSISADEVPSLLARTQYVETQSAKHLIKEILDGAVAIFYGGKCYVVNVYKPDNRSIEQSETEAVITGPHDSFIETAEVNLSLIRQRVKSSHLKVMKYEVGEVTKTDVYVLYIDRITNMGYVRELSRRIQNIEIDAVHDGNMLVQYIDDHPNSVFPLFPTTERTDAAVSKLVSGRVLAIVDGSPSVISAPASFFEFFSSPDDYYQRWMLGTATRLLRFSAFIITIAFTALYVSVTTFHYEMIPEDLLLTLTESRSRVPFPPIYEALLLETTIELLREAGARLPTKIGQTIGIVGGIVIGQAAVQAGLTSNILIIAVASSAIASFVIPSYVMSASIRLIRFALIILAGMLGNMGLIMGMALVVIHLSGLTSLQSSYLTPVAPGRFKDWRDVFIRAPFWMLKERPTQSKSPNEMKNKMKE